jgi:hypothetical protein
VGEAEARYHCAITLDKFAPALPVFMRPRHRRGPTTRRPTHRTQDKVYVVTDGGAMDTLPPASRPCPQRRKTKKRSLRACNEERQPQSGARRLPVRPAGPASDRWRKCPAAFLCGIETSPRTFGCDAHGPSLPRGQRGCQTAAAISMTCSSGGVDCPGQHSTHAISAWRSRTTQGQSGTIRAANARCNQTYVGPFG